MVKIRRLIKRDDGMKILLDDWAAKEFKPVPSKRTLYAMAKSGQIVPLPAKVGRVYMVDENAEHVPLPIASNDAGEGMSEAALEILKNGATT